MPGRVYVCLRCGHRWVSTGVPRQCPRCWSRAIVPEEEVKLASIALKPWAYLLEKRIPPLPLPHEVLALPASFAALTDILARASRAGSIVLRNAIELLLVEAGIEPSKARELASKIAELPPSKIIDEARRMLRL
jgi:DNA-directed RNA polymerase subunit RPC12/RpoP